MEGILELSSFPAGYGFLTWSCYQRLVLYLERDTNQLLAADVWASNQEAVQIN